MLWTNKVFKREGIWQKNPVLWIHFNTKNPWLLSGAFCCIACSVPKQRKVLLCWNKYKFFHCIAIHSAQPNFPANLSSIKDDKSIGDWFPLPSFCVLFLGSNCLLGSFILLHCCNSIHSKWGKYCDWLFCMQSMQCLYYAVREGCNISSKRFLFQHIINPSFPYLRMRKLLPTTTLQCYLHCL